MKSTVTFYGGAGSVTGANFLLDTGSVRVLVDCGTVAVDPSPSDVNHEPFRYDVRSVQALIVTHAHADHIGRIPKLVRDGFHGAIYSTGATRDIAEIMFEDALHIMQEEEQTTGTPMLYDADDIERAMALWQAHTYHKPFRISDMSVEFSDAGHILGSALVRISRGERSILFTGDLGNTPEPILRDTESPEGVNYLVMESVYGDRLHEDRSQRKEMLRSIIEDVRVNKGTLLIPSFSVERTQVLLYEIHGMINDGSMAPIPIYMDSPLASRVTPIFRTYAADLNDSAKALMESDGDLFTFPGLSVTKNKHESVAIHKADNPKVIIAGAGMSAGGRIRSHETAYLGDKNATVLFVGYQAPGTLGRRLQDGAGKVHIDGEYIRVHARIMSLSGYSGHADRDQLMRFVENTGQSLEKVFVTMGETKASLFLAQRITDFLDVPAIVPKKGESQEIDL